jgi:hypothetical protein
VSEELENSLQQAIETYLNDRLRSIDEQVSRLQTEVNEALRSYAKVRMPKAWTGRLCRPQSSRICKLRADKN